MSASLRSTPELGVINRWKGVKEMHWHTIRGLFATVTLLPCLVPVYARAADEQEAASSVLACPTEIPNSRRDLASFIAESDALLMALRRQGLDGLQGAIQKSAVFGNDNYSLSLQYHVGQLTSVEFVPGTSEQDMAFFVHFSGQGEPKVIAQRNLFWSGEHMLLLENGRPMAFRTVERETQNGATAFYRKGLQITWDESGRLMEESVQATREPLLEFRKRSRPSHRPEEGS